MNFKLTFLRLLTSILMIASFYLQSAYGAGGSYNEDEPTSTIPERVGATQAPAITDSERQKEDALKAAELISRFTDEEIEMFKDVLPSSEFIEGNEWIESPDRELRDRLQTLYNLKVHGTFFEPGQVEEDCQIRMSLKEYCDRLKVAFPEPKAVCYSVVLEAMGLSLIYRRDPFEGILRQIKTVLSNSGPDNTCYHPLVISQLIKAILVRNAMFMYSEWPYPETVGGYLEAYGKITSAIP